MTRIGSVKKRPGLSSNVLCLGVSYACVEEQLATEGVSWSNVAIKEACVEQTVELVRRNVLTEMDGRDLARCQSMEEEFGIKAYTVSQECGARYAANHLHGNFNRGTFLKEISKKWSNIKFQQIILDYFWIPQGSWVMKHWARSFFKTALPGFVQGGLLEFASETHDSNGLGIGNVYLPFCFHCVKQIVSSLDVLSQYYTISFVYKSELGEHALWAGTSKICPNTMQEWLGKRLDQEEVYCTFTSKDVKGSIEDEHVTKKEVVRVLERIEDFADVRMIRLKPLPIHNTKRRKRKVSGKVFGINIGGFEGLKPTEEVKNGYHDNESDESSKASKVSTEVSDRESLDNEDDTSTCATPRTTDESSCNDEDDYMTKDNVLITFKMGGETKTIMNLCPELHPIEDKYEFLKSTDPFSSDEDDDSVSTIDNISLSEEEDEDNASVGLDLLAKVAETYASEKQQISSKRTRVEIGSRVTHIERHSLGSAEMSPWKVSLLCPEGLFGKPTKALSNASAGGGNDTPCSKQFQYRNMKTEDDESQSRSQISIVVSPNGICEIDSSHNRYSSSMKACSGSRPLKKRRVPYYLPLGFPTTSRTTLAYAG